MSTLAAPPQRPSLFEPVRRRWRAWFQSRLPVSDSLTLTQRNVYILPTRAGLMFAFTVLVLLVASINYQLNLGYLLTFLLAGAGGVSMHITHGTLRGLQLHLRTGEARFAGEPALLEVVLMSTSRRPRFGVGLHTEGMSVRKGEFTWVDVPAQGHASAQLSFVPATRGLHKVPTIIVFTRFPLGLFRAWAVWRPAAQVLAYPAPERPAAPLPAARPVAGAATAQARMRDGGEWEGIRAYRRGDPLKLVVWKKAAKTLDAGGELVSRDTSTTASSELWLDWVLAAGADAEARLSRLAAWVELAERHGVRYGLALPGRELAPASGAAHRRDCLEALATWR